MRDPKTIFPHHEPESNGPKKAGRVLPLLQYQAKPNRKRASQRAEMIDEDLPLETDLDATSPQTLRARAGFIHNIFSRLAIKTAPLSSWLYDCQISLGKGVRVASHRLQLPHFPTGAPPLKVAFLSDLHYGPTSGKAANRMAWKLAREANPDVVLLGGDYLFADERGLPTLLRELQRWKFSPPSGGIYAVLGNHDYYAGKETIITTLEACGVRVLINEAAPLPSPWKGIWIAGVDDLWHGEPDLAGTLNQTSPDACTILMAHEPDICESGLMRRVAMTLCGHTHGGQVCLPNGDPIYVPSKSGKEYSGGLYRHAGQWLFVSRGVGTVNLPIRLFAPPDIGIFEFHGRATRGARCN